MALKKTLELQSNFGGTQSVKDVLIRVESVVANKEHATAYVELKKTEDGPIIEVRQYDFVPDMDGPNFIKQAYEHLKTLPEFAGATQA